MTISTLTIKNSYSGDGSTSAFTYTFKITDQDDIQVIIRSSTGTETVKTITTHYTVSGVGSAGGGTVTFTAGNIPTSGQTVILRRDTPQTQGLDLIENDPLPANSLEDALDKITSISQELQEEVDRSLKLSRTNTMTSTEFTVGASDRANKILAFDSSGEISVTQELGTYKGTDATTTTTAYVQRDIVKSTTVAQLNNVYICIQDSPAGTLLTNTSYWSLLIDAVSAATSVTAAAASASAAASSASAAATSESNAGTSESNAATSESNASTSATNAANSATSAANSATTATSQASAASSSASAAASSESNAATSESNAATSETNASNSATAAASSASTATTQASNAASSASSASTSASNAASSASTATTQATNAATSASNAASSATAASNAQTSVENIFDNFDDRFLGTKTSDPTLDNDGNALSVGAVYYNSTANQVRFYNGSTWDAPAASAATSATNAANSATAAANSASAAASSESNAATSESNAAASESSASTSASNASSSASSASASASTATTQAGIATTKAGDASTSATSAANSASSASSSAATATTQATNASNSASAAATSESNASTSASNAATSASNAASSASTATTQATNAANSATSAANSFDAFDDRFLGAKSSDPSLDNDGNALIDGALYWNNSDNVFKVYDLGNTQWNRTVPTASDQTKINIVSNDLSGSNTVGTVATSITDVQDVAANISGVNSFAERYRVASSDPTTSLDAGDLAFNTTGNVFKYYDGSAWQGITAGGITDVAQDSTPQLGGNLDLNSNDITGTGNVNITGNVTSTNLSGNGSGLTSLNASNLSSGTVPDARISATSVNQHVDLSNLNATNLTSGTIPDARFPATLPAISGANLTNLDANDLASGTVPDARFPATLPAVSGANLTSLNASNLSSGTINIARIADNSITNAKLANESITINGSTVVLGGSTTIQTVTYPTITSISPSAITNSASNIVITGTNYVITPLVEIISTSGKVYFPNTVTRNSSTQLTVNATIPDDGTYFVRVENPDGLAVRSSTAILTVSDAPTWNTVAGDLGSISQGESFSTTLSASSDSAITYSVVFGGIPTGLTLNANTGVLSGTESGNDTQETVYSFTVRATDAESQTVDRAFSITVVTGITASGQFN